MIFTLKKSLPLRLRSPIISNVLSRSKFELIGIKEDHVVGGLSLPTNDLWKDFYKKTHLKYVTKNRIIQYKIDNDHIIGFRYFCDVKCWSLYEINYVKEIIDEEINYLCM